MLCWIARDLGKHSLCHLGFCLEAALQVDLLHAKEIKDEEEFLRADSFYVWASTHESECPEVGTTHRLNWRRASRSEIALETKVREQI